VAQASSQGPVEYEPPGHGHARPGRAIAYVNLAMLATGGFQNAYRESIEFQAATLISAAIRHTQVTFGQVQRVKPNAA